ncbi:MAG: ATP-binding protein [Bacteroidales bacterium]
MYKINFYDVLKQLYYDLLGKDSQRGITLTYSWLCNQWGHFGLGFVPAILMGTYSYLQIFGLDTIIVAGLLICVLATLFEIINFLWTLFVTSRHKTFDLDYSNVAFDTFTDIIFFYIGGLSAIQVLSHIFNITVSSVLLYLFIAIGVYALLVFPYWYVSKMYIQNARFPFQCRLSQWKFSIPNSVKKQILEALKSNESKHILLFGGQNTGKTSLAVGFATERAIKRKPVVYTTAIKSSPFFLSSDETIREKDHVLWSWRQASCMVIDDINVGTPVPDCLTPDFFRSLIFTPQYSEINKKALCCQTVIWVIGGREHKNNWLDLIAEIGIDKQNILIVDL